MVFFHDELVIWEYKYLGIEPTDPKKQKTYRKVLGRVS